MTPDVPLDRNPLRPPNPLREITKDVLSRDKFSKNLARIICAYDSPDSLTIGLYGPWGSGKSTLLNFVVEEIKTLDSAIVVERFNPWNFADQNQLLSAFLRFFSTLLNRKDMPATLKAAAKILDNLAIVAAPAALLGGGFLKDMLKGGADVLRGEADNLADVERMKDAVSKAIGESGQRFVIVMDDLDRLTSGEIRQVFQLVKSVADFTNVVYLMAFDRKIVTAALHDVSSNQGGRYLEKVVNVPIGIPPLTERQARRLVLEVISAYSDRHSYNWDLDTNKRLADVLGLIIPHFSTVRLVERFSNMLAIVEDLVKGEVDYSDHLALTAIESFEPDFYDFMSSNAKLFVGDLISSVMPSDEDDAAYKSAIEQGLKALQILTHDELLAILKAVFPKVEYLFDRQPGSKHWGDEVWLRENRACADFSTYARYFILRVEDGDVSNVELFKAIDAATDVATFESMLSKFEGRERIGRLLERLEGVQDVDEAKIRVIVTALLDVGDTLGTSSSFGDFLFGVLAMSVSVATNLLRRLPIEQRGDIVASAFNLPLRSLEAPASFITGAIPEKVPGGPEPLFTTRDLDQLKGLLVAHLKSAFESGLIFDHPRAAYLLYKWFHLDLPDMKTSIRAKAEADERVFLRLLDTFSNVPVSGYMHPVPLDLQFLNAVYTTQELEDHLNIIGRSSGSTAEDAVRLRGLLEAAKALPTAAPPQDDDDDDDVPPEGNDERLPIVEL